MIGTETIRRLLSPLIEGRKDIEEHYKNRIKHENMAIGGYFHAYQSLVQGKPDEAKQQLEEYLRQGIRVLLYWKERVSTNIFEPAKKELLETLDEKIRKIETILKPN